MHFQRKYLYWKCIGWFIGCLVCHELKHTNSNQCISAIFNNIANMHCPFEQSAFCQIQENRADKYSTHFQRKYQRWKCVGRFTLLMQWLLQYSCREAEIRLHCKVFFCTLNQIIIIYVAIKSKKASCINEKTAWDMFFDYQINHVHDLVLYFFVILTESIIEMCSIC